jgi:hypothetical protein
MGHVYIEVEAQTARGDSCIFTVGLGMVPESKHAVLWSPDLLEARQQRVTTRQVQWCKDSGHHVLSCLRGMHLGLRDVHIPDPLSPNNAPYEVGPDSLPSWLLQRARTSSWMKGEEHPLRGRLSAAQASVLSYIARAIESSKMMWHPRREVWEGVMKHEYGLLAVCEGVLNCHAFVTTFIYDPRSLLDALERSTIEAA